MLHLSTYLIREHVGFMKLTDTYDIYDASTNEKICVAKEEPSGFVKVMRLLISKKLMPTTVNVYEEGSDRPLFSIYRGLALFRTNVHVRDAGHKRLGYFKSKIFTLGGGFWVYDH